MATPTIARARRWSIALPVIGAVLLCAVFACLLIGVAPEFFFGFAWGLVIVTQITLAAWVAERPRSQRVRSGVAVLRGLSMGFWFLPLGKALAALLGNTWGPGGVLLAMWASTAVLAGWVTGAAWVGKWIAGASVACVIILPAGGPGFGSFAMPVLWQAFVGFTLGRWIVAEARLRLAQEGACPACEYPLVGLPAGVPCPECGNISTPDPRPAATR